MTGDDNVLALPQVSFPEKVTVPPLMVAESALLAPVGPLTPAFQLREVQVLFVPFQVKGAAKAEAEAARPVSSAAMDTTGARARRMDLVFIVEFTGRLD